MRGTVLPSSIDGDVVESDPFPAQLPFCCLILLCCPVSHFWGWFSALLWSSEGWREEIALGCGWGMCIRHTSTGAWLVSGHPPLASAGQYSSAEMCPAYFFTYGTINSITSVCAMRCCAVPQRHRALSGATHQGRAVLPSRPRPLGVFHLLFAFHHPHKQ